MVTITVNGAQSSFKNGKLGLDYFTTYFQFGDYPQQFSGTLQVKPEDGVTNLSTEDEVKDVALAKIKAMVATRSDAPENAPTTTAS